MPSEGLLNRFRNIDGNMLMCMRWINVVVLNEDGGEGVGRLGLSRRYVARLTRNGPRHTRSLVKRHSRDAYN